MNFKEFNNFASMLALFFRTDGYKLDHRRQYPKMTQFIYGNVTARNGRIEGSTGIVAAGQQATLIELFTLAQSTFFDRPLNEVLSEYQDFLDGYLGPNDIGTDHIASLHSLGYLPLEFRSVPEGSFVPYGVPFMTIENTLPEFFWLTNYFETFLSAEIWLTVTSATTARQYRQILDGWAEKTSDTPEFVDWQGHDFSYRGMEGSVAAAKSGMGHLLFFTGTDTVPAIFLLKHSYFGEGLIGGTIPATEHSVMCAGGEEGEKETYARLIELYKKGPFSAVSDTWNLWDVITVTAVELKEEILGMDGKIVFRPDSGDPVKIICGDPEAKDERARKGVVQLLWEIFGGEINSKGYKVLNPHVGVIYGDSITTDRAERICAGLAEQGFASTNVVFGIGSFTYQYVTRDTHGMAMKTTYAVIGGDEKALFKKPVTDDGGKFSARGRLAVQRGTDGRLMLVQNLNDDDWVTTPTELRLIARDGDLTSPVTLAEIRERVRSELHLT